MPDKEHAETSMLALHLLQSALVNTLLVQQVLAEQAWASRLSEEGRRGLTALFSGPMSTRTAPSARTWTSASTWGRLPPCPAPAPRRTPPTDRVRRHSK
jgi:hypothetical protein